MAVRTLRLAAIAVLFSAAVAGSIVMTPWMHSERAASPPDRVFELRVYHTYPGRLPQLQSNFRNHNILFLKKHGITSLGYWTPQDSPASENTLIFLLVHES